MEAYAYKAALYCADCADDIKARLTPPVVPDDESSFDSDDYPKGPYDCGGGEADSPQHCDGCGLFLENPLTNEGADRLRLDAEQFETTPDMSWEEIAQAAEATGFHTFAQWTRFYFAYGQ